MFEKALEEKLKTIFSLERVRYDMPSSDDPEQETIFVEITEARPRIKDQIELCTVKGKLHIIAQSQKLPFGFFMKGISAHPDETKDLFFYDFEENSRRENNIVERSVSFIYFFNGQYDPALGTITSVEFDMETHS